MIDDPLADILNKPMAHCPCCGKDWPAGFKPFTYGEWFGAVGKAVEELGEPKELGEFAAMVHRAAAIAREARRPNVVQ